MCRGGPGPCPLGGFAWLDEIARAEGEIISSARPQIIQNLEGGILAELLIKEGDVVLRCDRTSLTDRQAGMEICSRMQARAELHTGEKTVLQYLLKPLYKLRRLRRHRFSRLSPSAKGSVWGIFAKKKHAFLA